MENIGAKLVDVTPWGPYGSSFIQTTLPPTGTYTVVPGMIVLDIVNVILTDGCGVGVGVGVTVFTSTGGRITRSTIWITPLLQTISVLVTLAPPIVTPSVVLIFRTAPCIVFASPSLVTSTANNVLLATTWLSRICF